VEDANGILFVSERSIHTIVRKNKEADEYDRHIMRDSHQKGTWNNTVVPGDISSL